MASSVASGGMGVVADKGVNMKIQKKIRLWLVMRAANLLKVPICPHQSYLAEDGVQRALLREQPIQSGRILDFPTSGVSSVGRIDHK